MIPPCFRLPASYFSVRFAHFWPEPIAAAWCHQKSCAVAFTCAHSNAFCCLSLLFYLWVGIVGFLALQEIYKITTWTQLARLISSLFRSVEQHLCWLNTCWVFFSLPKLLLSLAGFFLALENPDGTTFPPASLIFPIMSWGIPHIFPTITFHTSPVSFCTSFFSRRVACVCVHLSEFSFSILLLCHFLATHPLSNA